MTQCNRHGPLYCGSLLVARQSETGTLSRDLKILVTDSWEVSPFRVCYSYRNNMKSARKYLAGHSLPVSNKFDSPVKLRPEHAVFGKWPYLNFVDHIPMLCT